MSMIKKSYFGVWWLIFFCVFSFVRLRCLLCLVRCSLRLLCIFRPVGWCLVLRFLDCLLFLCRILRLCWMLFFSFAIVLSSNPFTAKLVDGTGKPQANAKITFNINGVFYERTTNESGIAKLNINLQKGKYIITSSYNGAKIANTVTVLSWD